MRVAYLTMDDVEGFFIYDALTHEPLRARGIEVDPHPWRARDVDWARYDAVVIRSTWDYQDDADAFLEVLTGIDRSTRLLNPLDVVRWNLDKRYLGELDRAGATIVPTRFVTPTSVVDLHDAAREVGSGAEVVAKPAVSANADHTYRLSPDGSGVEEALVGLRGRPSLVQPFMSRIVDEGEYSLFYFGGDYSHAILKTPKADDFRVQEEHGGRLRRIDPGPRLRERGDRALRAIPHRTLYARVDLVRTDGDDFAVMEAELIEPSLYFQLDPASPDRFADALARWLTGGG